MGWVRKARMRPTWRRQQYFARVPGLRELGERDAQGTLEYALTMVALLAVVVACAALWRAGQDGAFARLVEAAASHTLGAAGAVDISLY